MQRKRKLTLVNYLIVFVRVHKKTKRLAFFNPQLTAPHDSNFLYFSYKLS